MAVVMREIMRAVDPVVNHNVFYGGNGRIPFTWVLLKEAGSSYQPEKRPVVKETRARPPG
jgi:hypothetical protein